MQTFLRQYHYVQTRQLPILQAASCGQGNQEYNWDASVRKERLVVLQVTLSGCGFLEHHGEVKELPAGSAFLAAMPGNFRYYGEDWQFFYLEFSSIFSQWLELPLAVFQLTEEELNHWQKQIQQLEELPLSLYKNAQMAMTLFLEINTLLAKKQVPQDPLIKRVKKYLDRHFQEDLSLTEVADHFGLSKYQLIRKFGENYHTTPITYLKKIRVIHSLELLLGEDKIATIARQVGYANGNYFSKVFRSEMGMSPSEYRDSRKRYGQ